MAAEHAVNLGFFETQSAAKKKREDDYASAVAAMTQAIARLPSVTSEDTGGVPLIAVSSQELSEPLLRNMSPNSWATLTLKIIEKLKEENPRNTKFLTEVLKITTDYINNPHDQNIFTKYDQMREKVATKYGLYSALSFALLGLPTSILIGGLIGAVALSLAFPAMIPVIAIVGTVIILSSALVSAAPTNVSSKISISWDNLKDDLGSTSRPSLSR